MWMEYIENKEVIKGIYKNQIPDFGNIILKEINICTGSDVNLILVFDIVNLPDYVPPRWIENKYNTVQIILNLIGVEIKKIDLSNFNSKNISLKIYENNKATKRIIGIDKTDICVFEFVANWIYVKNISGYNNGTNDLNKNK